MPCMLAVDIGGTFTDLVAYDLEARTPFNLRFHGDPAESLRVQGRW